MYTLESWQETTRVVLRRMGEHTASMIVALSRILSHEEATPLGTGTYISLRGKTYVLTNEHVARFMESSGIAHYPRHNDYAHRLTNAFIAMTSPVDAALSRIDDASWKATTKEALAAERLDRKHEPVERELLFIHGFPGERSRWSAFAEGLVMDSIPYLTQEAPPPSSFHPNLFALHYNPELAREGLGKSEVLPLPPGFSGSLVWNTRFVENEMQNNSDWSPEKATATGLVCTWGENQLADRIFAVRIEVVREFILLALCQEAAYFHWLHRGSPFGSPLEDWLFAETEIAGLA